MAFKLVTAVILYPASITFARPDLNLPVTAIGGHDVLSGEQTIRPAEKKVLVFTGCAVFDTTCCGAGGCAYALVSGFVGRYRYLRDAAGQWLSKVTPVREPDLRQAATAVVLERTEAMQVQFL